MNSEFFEAAKTAPSVKEVIELLNEHDMSPWDIEDGGYEEVFEFIESVRDEGSGDFDGCHAVILHKPSNTFIMKTGWYTSYDGMNFDDSWAVAQAVQVHKTEYRYVKEVK